MATIVAYLVNKLAHFPSIMFSRISPHVCPEFAGYDITALVTIPCILQHINHLQAGSRIDIQTPSFINASQKAQHPGLRPQDTISMVNLAEESFSVKSKTDAHGT
jgi:hypothetical protein